MAWEKTFEAKKQLAIPEQLLSPTLLQCLCYQKLYLANKIYIEQQQNYTNQRLFSQWTLPISLSEDHTDYCQEELNSKVSQQQK